MTPPYTTSPLSRSMRYLAPLALAALTALTACNGDSGMDEAAIQAKAKEIHSRVLSLDTHVDISPSSFTDTAPNYAQRLDNTQVDLVKMEEGGLSGAFLAVYVGQGPDLNAAGYARAHDQAMAKFNAIHHLVEVIAPDRAELALTSADARRIHESGKRVIFIGVENGYPIGTDIGNVKKFYDLGARYMSLAHNGHSQLSDSNTGERDSVWMWHGLSPLGKEVIAEMNRLGMMIDVSHPSRESMMQAIELSKAPIIASHSGVRAICNHSRNLDDEQLDAFKKNGGVIQLVAFKSYVKCDPSRDIPREKARAEAMDQLRNEFGITGANFREQQAAIRALPEDRRAEFQAKQEDIYNVQFPSDPPATVSDFVDHIDYVVKRIGIDHAGIAADFDGGGGVEGWNSASETGNVTLELVRRGYSEEDIAKIMGGNLLRVLDEVQAVAREIQGGSGE